MICVLWDIDGTLVTYQEPANSRYLDYFSRRGFTPQGKQPELVGTTEAGIMAHFLGTDDMEVIKVHLRAMDVEWLASSRGKASALQSAKSLSDSLSASIVQTVVTGNTYLRALTKLSESGMLKSRLEVGIGGFGDEGVRRTEIVGRCVSRFDRLYPCVDSDEVRFVVIGDTPVDAIAGKAAGVDVLLVSTGKYSQRELAATEADVVVEDLWAEREHVYAFLGC